MIVQLIQTNVRSIEQQLDIGHGSASANPSGGHGQAEDILVGSRHATNGCACFASSMDRDQEIARRDSDAPDRCAGLNDMQTNDLLCEPKISTIASFNQNRLGACCIGFTHRIGMVGDNTIMLAATGMREQKRALGERRVAHGDAAFVLHQRDASNVISVERIVEQEEEVTGGVVAWRGCPEHDHVFPIKLFVGFRFARKINSALVDRKDQVAGQQLETIRPRPNAQTGPNRMHAGNADIGVTDKVLQTETDCGSGSGSRASIAIQRQSRVADLNDLVFAPVR